MRSNKGLRLLSATSAIALLSIAAQAQEADNNVETVVVTGSRVISDAANSPTPLTVVTVQQLEATTPSNVPDALNKLPVFQGSSSPRSINNASSSPGNYLSLRNFGSSRTLLLFDGHRVAPSNANGSTDVDTLPQMLMQRVDVVTGGASAVYGSDAVTGVVNFILDKHFNGVKMNASAGISGHADAASYKAGLALGTDLFGGRGHIEGSAAHFHKDGVRTVDRKLGDMAWELAGAGTAANPYVTIHDPTLPLFSYGGKITCAGTTANPCAANGQQFIQNGIIGPFNAGTPTGTNNVNTGGDGARSRLSMITAHLTTDEAFGRFSYNLDDTTSFYVQAMAGQSIDRGTFQNNYYQTGTVPNTFYKNNPFLTPEAKALLAGGTASTFQLAKYINNQGPTGGFLTWGTQRTLGMTTGIDGTLADKYDWDVFFTHGEGRVKVDNPHNQFNQNMYASLDAVTNPANGTVVCYASLPANVGATVAARYSDCVPANPFGPTALTKDAYNYFIRDSYFITSNTLDDLGGSISGSIFDLPAGPIKAALSGEMRWQSYKVDSNALPTDVIDCTGLRICSTAAVAWQGNIANSQPEVSNNVWEFAGEAEIPLLKDIALVQSLSANIAGRYTDYSTSGAVQTWKIGLDYHVDDNVRFRATTSVDIRAPTLDDLFSPIQLTRANFLDIHTHNTQGLTSTGSSGNPNLVPEVARTYTGGVVFTPTFIPGFTASVDYYNIALKNVIGSISGTSTTTQNLCEASNGTSPFCALYIRPGPFSDTSAANFPSKVLSLSLNTAFNKIEGWDIELNYAFQMADVIADAPGSVALRLLTNYQPVQQSQSFPGAPLTASVISKGHVTGFFAYTLNSWTFSVQDRWISSFNKASLPTQVYLEPRGPAINYTDINIDKQFVIDDQTIDAYLSVENLFDQEIPIVPTNQVSPGLYYLGIQGSNTSYDAIGRYFTLGMRAKF